MRDTATMPYHAFGTAAQHQEVVDLQERLAVLVERLSCETYSFDEDTDSIGWYVDRSAALGDTISRERVIELQGAWDNTPARCCGYRSDLPKGLCAAHLRDGKPFDAEDATALADHLWAVGNPLRIRLAQAVSGKLTLLPVPHGYIHLARRLVADLNVA